MDFVFGALAVVAALGWAEAYRRLRHERQRVRWCGRLLASQNERLHQIEQSVVQDGRRLGLTLRRFDEIGADGPA